MRESINILEATIPTKVYFSNKPEKDQYIRKEFEATLQERNWRFTCPVLDIAKAIAALAKAQRHFAIMSGYLPNKKDKYILERAVKQEPILA